MRRMIATACMAIVGLSFVHLVCTGAAETAFAVLGCFTVPIGMLCYEAGRDAGIGKPMEDER